MIRDDTQGFDQFVATEWTWLRGQAYLLCSDWHEAEDLVQETLVRLYRRWPLLCYRQRLRGYARTTLVRVFLNSRRAHRFRREALCADLPEVPGVQRDEPAADASATLEAALACLGPRQRAVIVLRFLGDLSVDDVARALNVTRGTVTSQTHRALASLRETLQGTA